MKSIEAAGLGIENLRLVERPRPEPGPGEVLIKLNAASLNYRDLLNIQTSSTGFSAASAGAQGAYLPASDGAGEIAAIGPGVSRVAIGDRVATLFHQGWIAGRRPMDSFVLGGPGPGTLQEYICLSAQGVAKFPAHLSDAEAATLTCAGLTAWSALADVKGGDVVLVQGTGGVSIFALQFAKARGASVILTSSSDEKLARGKALGADHLINYKKTPQWGAAAREMTNGEGVNCVVEVGGADTIAQSLDALARGGTVSIVGLLSGLPQQAPLLKLVLGAGRLVGIAVGNRDQFEDMARAIDAGNIRPVVDKTFPLAESRAAFEHLKSGRHFGKVCIAIPG